MSEKTTPHALLFTAPGCPHCPGVKAALERLRDEGVIGSLEVVSVAEEQARAAELGIRSVPWLRLGDFILTGAQTPQQLRQWAEKAGGGAQAMAEFLEYQLANGRLDEAEKLLRDHPEHLEALLDLLENPEAKIQVRLGVSAIIEGLEGSETLKALLPRLVAMSEHANHQLRTDACHFLGLTRSSAAKPPLRRCLADENAEVREIAADALALLRE